MTVTRTDPTSFFVLTTHRLMGAYRGSAFECRLRLVENWSGLDPMEGKGYGGELHTMTVSTSDGRSCSAEYETGYAWQALITAFRFLVQKL